MVHYKKYTIYHSLFVKQCWRRGGGEESSVSTRPKSKSKLSLFLCLCLLGYGYQRTPLSNSQSSVKDLDAPRLKIRRNSCGILPIITGVKNVSYVSVEIPIPWSLLTAAFVLSKSGRNCFRSFHRLPLEAALAIRYVSKWLLVCFRSAWLGARPRGRNMSQSVLIQKLFLRQNLRGATLDIGIYPHHLSWCFCEWPIQAIPRWGDNWLDCREIYSSQVCVPAWELELQEDCESNVAPCPSWLFPSFIFVSMAVSRSTMQAWIPLAKSQLSLTSSSVFDSSTKSIISLSKVFSSDKLILKCTSLGFELLQNSRISRPACLSVRLLRG